MNKLHSIHVLENEIVLIFDENHVPVDESPAEAKDKLLDALDFILNDPAMTEEDRDKLRNMSIARFCDLLHGTADAMADEPVVKHIGARKMDVIKHPENFACAYCGAMELQCIDGHLSCNNCGVIYGDFDELPDMI